MLMNDGMIFTGAPVLRKFRPNDLGSVIELVSKIFDEDYNPEVYLRMSSLWPGGFILASTPEGPVGIVMGTITDSGEGRILLLGVNDVHRCAGLGKRLHEAFVRECAMRGINRITLEVRKSNTLAILFYKKLGYLLTDMMDNYYSDGECACKLMAYL